MKKSKWRSEAGFSMLEIVIGIGIMGFLATVTYPEYIERNYVSVIARNVADQANALLDAAKYYHFENRAWPTLTELKAAKLIAQDWEPKNPWGGEFRLSVPENSPNVELTITQVPPVSAKYMRLTLPTWQYNATTGTATVNIPPPGMEPSLDNLVKRSGGVESNMYGDLVMQRKSATDDDPSMELRRGGTKIIRFGQNQDKSYGIERFGGTGDLSLKADRTQNSGKIKLEGKGLSFSSQNGEQMSIDENGNLLVNDIRLKALGNGQIPLSINNRLPIYTANHKDGDVIEVADVGPGVAYEIYVAPSIFGTGTNLNPNYHPYPITDVRSWAEPLGPRRWEIKIRVQALNGDVWGAGNNRWSTVTIYAILPTTTAQEDQ